MSKRTRLALAARPFSGDPLPSPGDSCVQRSGGGAIHVPQEITDKETSGRVIAFERFSGPLCPRRRLQQQLAVGAELEDTGLVRLAAAVRLLWAPENSLRATVAELAMFADRRRLEQAAAMLEEIEDESADEQLALWP